MAEGFTEERKKHALVLKDRKLLEINGVLEVLSFDDVSVLLKTQCGELYIEGSELHISTLDTAKGDVSVNGTVDSFSYSDMKQNDRRGKFGRFIK